MQHRYPNSSSIILNGLDRLRTELERQKIDIDIDVAAEYYLDDHLYELLKKDDILTFGDDYLLFEMSYVMAPADLETIVFEMQCSGYRPVLAHPERFLHMHHDFEKYESLKERGVLFQIDINSLGGYYSKSVRKIALKLVENGMVDFIGTDTHHQRHIDALRKTVKSKSYKRLFQNNLILIDTLL
jgi:tyrosine-protein phosphatase YwqE